MRKHRRTKEEYEEAIKNSHSIAEALRKLNIVAKGGNYRIIKNAITKYNIDISHFTGQGWNKGLIVNPNPKLELKEILIENSSYNSYKLKQRLFSEGLKQHQCENCKRTEWEGVKIPLELHHINGDNTDNRIENLQILCPNCHALTENYRGRKKTPIKRKVVKTKKDENNETNCASKFCPVCGKEVLNKKSKYCSLKCAHTTLQKLPDDETMMKHIQSGLSNIDIGKIYGVSESAVRKWKKRRLKFFL